jgi:hypothetical protein
MKTLMMTLAATAALLSISVSANADGPNRTVTGAAIGAGTGAVVAGPPGAVIGGVVGAVVGGPKIGHHRHRVCHIRNHRRVCSYR